MPLVASCVIGVCAIAAIVYLLWPTWTFENAGDPDRLPVTIGNTLFNVPTKSIRVKLQKRTGPQERVDLAFMYPSLTPPDAQKHVTATTVDEAIQPIDRIFLSISAHHGALSPDERVRTIYPRYLDPSASNVSDTLTVQAFRAGTPYAGEDLYLGDGVGFVARCMRDAATPGMCISERRIDGADLNFRFPRAWLAQWHDVADAMDRLTAWMREARS